MMQWMSTEKIGNADEVLRKGDHYGRTLFYNSKGLGKVGYVANSPFTVKGESMSAGRLYDKIGDKAKGKVVFVTDGGVICKVISDGKDKPVMIEEDKVYDEDQLGFKI